MDALAHSSTMLARITDDSALAAFTLGFGTWFIVTARPPLSLRDRVWAKRLAWSAISISVVALCIASVDYALELQHQATQGCTFPPRFLYERVAWQLVPRCLIPLIGLGLSLLAFRRLANNGGPPSARYCACGYSLTGNVSGTCPECGVVVPVNLVQGGDSAGQDSKAGQHNEQAEPEP